MFFRATVTVGLRPPPVREGIYLFEHGIDPYSGGAFRHVRDKRCLISLLLTSPQSPLLLSLFSTALPLTPYTSLVLWAATDSVAAWALVRIWRLRVGAKSTTRDWQVAALYVHSSYRAACFSSRLAKIFIQPICPASQFGVFDVFVREHTFSAFRHVCVQR